MPRDANPVRHRVRLFPVNLSRFQPHLHFSMWESEKSESGLRTIVDEFDTDRYGLQRLHAKLGNTDGLFVDIGANIGFFTVIVGLLFPRATVISFEPQPSTFANLIRNVRHHNLTSRVTPRNYGLGFEDYKAKAAYSDLNSGGSSTYSLSGWGGKPDGEDVKDLKTHVDVALRDPVRKLDEMIAARGDIEYLKLDCEGCEYEVFASLPWHRILHFGFEVHGNEHVLDGAKRLSDNAVARYNASVEAIDALIKDPRGALRAQYVGGDQNGFYRVTREAVDLVDATRRKYGLPSLADSYIRAGAKGIRHGSGVD